MPAPRPAAPPRPGAVTWGGRPGRGRGPALRLDRTPPPPPVAPRLDADQRRVVDHPGGPLLVLAGPGTGKTTTLVEAVVERVACRGVEPDRLLVLTFSRRAAQELRERITSRLGRTVREPAAATFHSWCLALVRAWPDEPGGPPPRLLSAAERETRLRELLAGSAGGEGRAVWPEELRPALRLRGFARELGDLLDRARERGLDGPGLRELGERTDRPAWIAAGSLLEEHEQVMRLRQELDYPGLIGRAAELLAQDDVAAAVRARYAGVFVDEYQDTDPAQEWLLQRLAGGGGDLVVVGDPDQSIYGFRGADVAAIREFPARFPTASGAPAPVVALRTCRRMGAAVLAPSRALAARLPARDAAAGHRQLLPHGPEGEPPVVRVLPTGADEALAVADVLRRAHLEHGTPWSDMAVLVRSGVRSLPVLRRALAGAGVPVAVAADEIAVADDPVVQPLLGALRLAAVAAPPAAEELGVEQAEALLLSPLGGASPRRLRALGRALREAERAAGRPPAPSSVLLRDAVLDPGRVAGVDDDVAEPVRRLAGALDAARRALRDGTPEEALWALWHGSGWGWRLEQESASGGARGERADRDLDAALALFGAAARLEERRPRAGVAALLDELGSHVVPAPPHEEAVAAGGRVRLLTTHRSKGLEWELVVVAGVQEGIWPDLRRRGSLLAADAVGDEGLREPPTPAELLAEERRLLYVALTRARRRLVVTAVSAVDDDGDRPSRLLAELGLPVPEQAEPPAADLLAPGSLVARLRRAAEDPAASPALREAAAERLAVLAAPQDGVPLVAAADPRAWWGTEARTTHPTPLHPADRPLRLSGSQASAHERCPLRSFLERDAAAQAPPGQAQGFGVLLHGLAQAIASGRLAPDDASLEAAVDALWPALGHEVAWESARERQAALDAARRLRRWLEGRPADVRVEADFEVAGPAGTVLHGRADRVELDPERGLRVVDLKTGSSVPSEKETASDPQLAVYQLAARAGAFTAGAGGAAEGSADPDRADDPEAGADGAAQERLAGADGAAQERLAGAELVYLRQGDASGLPKRRTQPPLEPGPGWADDLVGRIAADLRAERVVARPGSSCDRCPVRAACPAHPSGAEVVP